MKKVLFFSGSLRKDSYNKKLALNAKDIADRLGVETIFINLSDYNIPLYNQDIEDKSGMPADAQKIKNIFIDSDAIFIASPEYNSSFSAALKNIVDWISRPSSKGEKPLIAFDNKVAAICAASPGALGGLRGLTPLRLLLSNIKVTVIPDQFALGKSFEAFDENGNLKDSSQLESVVNKLVSITNNM